MSRGFPFPAEAPVKIILAAIALAWLFDALGSRAIPHPPGECPDCRPARIADAREA